MPVAVAVAARRDVTLDGLRQLLHRAREHVDLPVVLLQQLGDGRVGTLEPGDPLVVRAELLVRLELVLRQRVNDGLGLGQLLCALLLARNDEIHHPL